MIEADTDASCFINEKVKIQLIFANIMELPEAGTLVCEMKN